MSIKNLLVSLALLFAFPATIMAGGSTIQVTESESYLRLLNAGDSGQNLMNFDVTVSDFIYDQIVLKDLEVSCFPVEGLNSVELLKNGRTLASADFSGTTSNQYQIAYFRNIESEIDGGLNNRFELQASVDDDAPNQTIMCKLQDIVFYNETDDFEYPGNYIYTDFATNNLIRIKNSSKSAQKIAYVYDTISPSRVLSSSASGIKIDDYKVFAMDDAVLDRVFLQCQGANSVRSAYMRYDDGDSLTSNIIAESAISTDYPYIPEKTFIFTDIDEDLSEDFDFEFIVDTKYNNSSIPTSCWVISAVANELESRTKAVNTTKSKIKSNGIFSDVNSGTLIGNAANDLFERGIIEGFSDGEFKPNKSVNRAEAAKFLLLGKYKRVDENIRNNRMFSDVKDGNWYVPYVVRAAELRIINGYDNGQFKPADPVNTAEFLKMLTLTFDLSTKLSYEYDDVDSDDWFAKYAGVAQEYSLFPGRGSKLYPSRELSRGEVAIAMHRYFENR
ncbi:MAG: S-layer homology domain-containing protein [Ignavibacteriae bacterium]|nr:S-layer homology domain-containing protein [Ignavibacteriota bacterium]